MRGFGLLLLLALSSPQAPPETLEVRNAHALAYHRGLGKTVLFGGADERSVRGDTWTWDGTRWELLTTDGPTPRTFPAMAYDEKRDELVLFGGNTVLFGLEPDPRSFLDDTWIFGAAGWRRSSSSGPGARAEAAIAYDEIRERIVLFGGHRLDDEGGRLRLGDTWEWDGEAWRAVSRDGPSPRNGASVAFSPLHQGVVLFGGNGPSGETWLWNGSVWTRLSMPEPPGRFNSGLARDPVSRGLVRFGGWNGKERVADTWLLGEAWTRLETEGPPGRNHAPIALDSGRNRVVLFGGHDGERVFGDTWEWDGARWIAALPGGSKMRVDNGH
ncbi:MAG: hypothetical protein ACRD21_05170 [Vicinamibacteria bacterium]